jgi:hypothetical protein
VTACKQTSAATTARCGVTPGAQPEGEVDSMYT